MALFVARFATSSPSEKKEGELAVCRRVKEEKVVLYFKLEYLNCDVMEMSPDNRTNLHRIFASSD